MFKPSHLEKDFLDKTLAEMEGRRMAATKRGRLALVLDCAQEGDHVIFLEGGRFLLIPRNSSSMGRLCMIEVG